MSERERERERREDSDGLEYMESTHAQTYIFCRLSVGKCSLVASECACMRCVCGTLFICTNGDTVLSVYVANCIARADWSSSAGYLKCML